ncbi:MAG: hypothetical protein HYU76_11500 [Betaproteobacteria bacterium]|nr:hypothetical protein [Betaproteobacteria bacterium]
MSQNINLFNPAFRKQRLQVSFAALAKCLGLTVIALLAFQFYLQHQVNGLTEELRTVEASLMEQRSVLDQLKGQAAVRKPDPQLDAEIAQLETELKQAQEAMDALKGGAFGNQEGFSEYLRAFSRQSVNGLWLTGFTISGGGELEIRGRVVRPDLVPSYIQRLNREKVLQGRSFARFEMSQPKPEPAADRDKGKDAKKAARPPRFLEFSLATTESGKVEKAR